MTFGAFGEVGKAVLRLYVGVVGRRWDGAGLGGAWWAGAVGWWWDGAKLGRLLWVCHGGSW